MRTKRRICRSKGRRTSAAPGTTSQALRGVTVCRPYFHRFNRTLKIGPAAIE
ncbi:predicted protein [Plenodomus lingam JN3]|uniref:Predicted protein n=1 Tax=Leptosphaeria maculans (strain JN3 / isolate v23.1.3 / race Av1-4-5-6-7-8) TaxID=985895 RepID=E5A4W6_LEPMJ|nr:predicted protein [Plenodomus lingam JN3]CBX98664.1 predicted protein [Plenodomus lingam JN3]